MHKKKYIMPWEAASFITAFLVFVGICILFSRLNLLNWVAMLFIALTAFGLNFRLYKNYSDSLIMSLVITEIFWAMLFLPIGPLTTGAVLIILNYSFWDFKSRNKEIWLNLILAGTAIALLLLTSKWS